jgi:hypothetical protein
MAITAHLSRLEDQMLRLHQPDARLSRLRVDHFLLYLFFQAFFFLKLPCFCNLRSSGFLEIILFLKSSFSSTEI